MSNDLEILTNVFSDAHVVDIDFSEWDYEVVFCILADHYSNWTNEMYSRCPILLIHFRQIQEFNVGFNHHDKGKLEDHKHYQWLTESVELEKKGDNLSLSIVGAYSAAPNLKIICRDVTIEEINHKDIDRRFKNWDKPGQGFIRKGIKKITNQK